MTLGELSEFYRMREQLRRDEEILRSLEETIAPGGQVLTGMPHAPGVRDKVGDLAVEIADIRTSVEKAKERLDRAEKKISSQIDTIQDQYLRMIFRLRFIHCLTWGEVAAVVGGQNTENSVKSACYRFLRTQKTCNGVTRHDT